MLYEVITEIEAAILAGLGDEDEPTEPAPIKTEAVRDMPQVVQPVEPGVIKGVGAAPGIAVGPVV